jgi:hypothetical protein
MNNSKGAISSHKAWRVETSLSVYRLSYLLISEDRVDMWNRTQALLLLTWSQGREEPLAA